MSEFPPISSLSIKSPNGSSYIGYIGSASYALLDTTGTIGGEIWCLSSFDTSGIKFYEFWCVWTLLADY